MTAESPSTEQSVLVGDVGGTHARFAVVDRSRKSWTIGHRTDLEEQFPQFADALRAYLERAGLEHMPKAAAIAIAGPVTEGSVKLTNRKWTVSEQDLGELGFTQALLLNDFAALAFGASYLEPEQLQTIGPELEGIASEPVSIVGAGTGFGASLLGRFRGRSVAVATEGGHMAFAPDGEQETEVLKILFRQFGRVSVERVLSGPGLENLHNALAEIAGRPPPALQAAQITESAENGDVACKETIDMFCGIYGAVAGDFALAHGARGGVFLAGGIAKKILPMLMKSAFRARFEDKGRLSHYVKPIPTRLILTEDATFLGAARASSELAEIALK